MFMDSNHFIGTNCIGRGATVTPHRCGQEQNGGPAVILLTRLQTHSDAFSLGRSALFGLFGRFILSP